MSSPIDDDPQAIDIVDVRDELAASGKQTAPKRTFVDGVRDCVPVVLGYLAIGMAFGVLARTSGLSVAEVVLMSLILYAGSAQFVLTGFIVAGTAAPAAILTIFLVNLRHLLYSAALAPHVRRLSALQNTLLAVELTDETFAVAASRLKPGDEASASWLFGINLTAHTTWVLATGLGAILGSALSNTSALGLDFALAAMFAALLVLQITSRSRLGVAIAVALIGAAVAVCASLVMAPSWAIILATVVAATAGVLIEGKQ